MSIDSNRPMVTMKQLADHREVIKPIFERFTLEVNKLLSQNKGVISKEQMEEAIAAAIKSVNISKSESDIVQGFFDCYVGGWNREGREAADCFASYIINWDNVKTQITLGLLQDDDELLN